MSTKKKSMSMNIYCVRCKSQTPTNNLQTVCFFSFCAFFISFCESSDHVVGVSDVTLFLGRYISPDFWYPICPS